jgi:O-glycosyl hydrolase
MKWLLIIPLLLLAQRPLVAHAQTPLNVDFKMQHQTIDGFGASDAWSIDPSVKKWIDEGREADVERLADWLFSVDTGIGLSAWRFNIGAGSAEQGASLSHIPDALRRAELLIAAPGAAIDPNKQRGQVRLLQEAYARGVENFVAFSNSPPVWATKNGLAHPGDGTGVGSTNLDPEQLENFSEFLVQVVKHLRDSAGVPVNYLSPINEPTWDWQGQSQEANRYNASEMKQVYRSLALALKAEGLESLVAIDAVEAVEYSAALSDSYKMQFDKSIYNAGMNSRNLGVYKNYIEHFLADEEMRRLLDNKISLHGYWSDAWPERLGTLRDLTWENVQTLAPGAKIWMSEYCILGDATATRKFGGTGFDPQDMNYALHVAKVIHRDLTRLNASAWHWWLALTPYNYKDGLIKINGALDPDSLQDSKVMWALGNFSRFIRPGFVRIDLPFVDNFSGLMASAYKNPVDNKLVVVAINASDKAQSININITNVPTDKSRWVFDVYLTDAQNNLSKVATTSGHYDLPANSLVTLVDTSNPATDNSSSSSSASSTSVALSSAASSVNAFSESGRAGASDFLLLLTALFVLISAQKNRQYPIELFTGVKK